jgi:hypothetical protein
MIKGLFFVLSNFVSPTFTMMAKPFQKKILSVLLLFLPVLSFAQLLQQDTLFIATSVQQVKKIYSQTIQGQARLYNGSDYLEYKPVGDEHPYYFSDDWVLSTVEYDGERFEKVPILYDISNDKLVTEHYYTSNKMQLVSELVQTFTVSNHSFVRLNENSSTGISIKTGFYEMLYSGPTAVYAKRTKTREEKISAEKFLEVSFTEKTRYYILKNAVYYGVNSKRSVLQILGDRKKELKHFIKEKHIRFKKDEEKALVDLVHYYDSLAQ